MNDAVFLLLGSNQGDAVGNLATARKAIAETAGTITGESSVYRSAAWGLEQQPEFRNQVLKISTPLLPQELLKRLLEIEAEMGRVRIQKWGPRLIDIDLLLYGDDVIDTPALRLPHPGIPLRRFTLVPLAEIAPDLRHPQSGKTIATLLKECPDTLPVEKV